MTGSTSMTIHSACRCFPEVLHHVEALDELPLLLSGTLGNLFTQRCGEFLQIENAQEFLHSFGADPRLESLVVGSAEPIFPFENDTSPFEGRIPLFHHDVTGILQCDGLNLGAEASGCFS